MRNQYVAKCENSLQLAYVNMSETNGMNRSWCDRHTLFLQADLRPSAAIHIHFLGKFANTVYFSYILIYITK